MIKKYLLLSDEAWKNMKKSIAASAVTNLSLIILSFITAFVFWQILQPFVGGQTNYNTMWMLFGAGIAAIVIIYFLYILEYNIIYFSGNVASSEKRISIAEHLRNLPLSFFEKKNLTDLANNIMSDCYQIEVGFTSTVPSLIGNLISIAFACLMICFFDWRMGIAIFITTPVSFGLILLTTRFQRNLSRRHYDTGLKMDAVMQEYLEGMKVTKAFGISGTSYRELEKACNDMKKVNMKTEVLSGSLVSISTIILRLGTPITIYVGTYLLTSGTLDPVYFLFFLLIAARIYGSLAAPLSYWGDIVYSGISLKRLAGLLNEAVMSGDDEIDIPCNEVEYDNVSFSYKEDEEVLKNISFTINEGQVTALVGPSGSGKSTISRLTARFWDPDRGDVRIGGVSLSRIDPEYLLKRISFVFQDVTLFNDSIFNNIRMGNENASREDILAAAKAANCDSIVSGLPDGYDTVINENGNDLSGGERQRISIARAILKDAPFIILDEATAALDPENEVEIQQALSRLVRGKTTLVIAHRLRTIVDSDQIIVMDKGKIVEKGTHDELMTNNGLYSRLYNIQQKSLGWTV